MPIKPVKVGQLNSYIKRILTSDPILGNVSVIGEISNLTFHSSGHVYFSLKDETSSVKCFLPASVFAHLRYELSEGMEITASGYVGVYERGGYYSLNIRDIEVCGEGELAVAFENMKKKLEAEGLFDPARKRKIPAFPAKIAVVTSETGAAVRDIIKIIKSRNNFVSVLVYPVLVQGPDAAADIAAALKDINARFDDVDVIIAGRGGGSAEDLWAFNEEPVARAIYASRIPVISAVGHETDFTIADFVADMRAETPTAAAVIACPNISELSEYMLSLKRGMLDSLKKNADIKRKELASLAPSEMKRMLMQKIAFMRLKADSAYKQLGDLSPQNIMKRGYAAVTDASGKLISSAASLSAGDILTVEFADGRADAEVRTITRKKEN